MVLRQRIGPFSNRHRHDSHMCTMVVLILLATYLGHLIQTGRNNQTRPRAWSCFLNGGPAGYTWLRRASSIT